ncbi:MAG: hypothetical protein U1E14_17240 [Geminicoccaceae bacterium]
MTALLAIGATTAVAAWTQSADAARYAEPVAGKASASGIVLARKGADDPAGDDRGGNRGGKSGGKGRGGHDDGPNHT